MEEYLQNIVIFHKNTFLCIDTKYINIYLFPPYIETYLTFDYYER